jgi:hypothetical protein
MSDELTTVRPADQAVYERTCVHGDCGKWGMFGLERGLSGSGYWCKEHLPDDYWSERPAPPADQRGGSGRAAFTVES